MKINLKYFKIVKNNGHFWIRIFGYGLLVKDVNKHPLIFSQRHGKQIHFNVGNYYIEVLKHSREFIATDNAVDAFCNEITKDDPLISVGRLLGLEKHRTENIEDFRKRLLKCRMENCLDRK